jgi:hypothetical protein
LQLRARGISADNTAAVHAGTAGAAIMGETRARNVVEIVRFMLSKLEAP